LRYETSAADHLISGDVNGDGVADFLIQVSAIDRSGPASSRIASHSSSRTGATDSRDWRISSIFASFGSALIALRVTGPSGRTGSTATDTQSGSFGSGRALAGDAHDPDHGALLAAMVEEGLVAGLHRPQVEPGGGVADSVPFGAAVADEVVPAVAAGLGFHQPMGHRRFLLGSVDFSRAPRHKEPPCGARSFFSAWS
jgi:hypothetical protein